MYVPLGTPNWAMFVEIPVSEAYQPVIISIILLAGSTLVVAILAGVIGLHLSRRLATPVLNLTETATHIAAGQLELEAPLGGTAEVSRLAAAFNSMTAQLRDLIQSLQRANTEITLAYDHTLVGWAHALELKDMETKGHSQRVVNMTIRLARAIGVSAENLVHLRRGALLHDIGKIGIPDSILLKPDKLSKEEWAIMSKHPEYVYEMISSISFLRPALDIPYYHHEKWDGSGYPHGLKGEKIPLGARIFAVVDIWDALNSDRPYREAWPEEKVLAYIQEISGTHLDPNVVEKFMKIIKKT
ncbi:MAG: HD domain-containing protein [Chloroflexi bacterium]|nr:HD domain-containing protein [Chloroflexota bacterium]